MRSRLAEVCSNGSVTSIIEIGNRDIRLHIAVIQNVASIRKLYKSVHLSLFLYIYMYRYIHSLPFAYALRSFEALLLSSNFTNLSLYRIYFSVCLSSYLSIYLCERERSHLQLVLHDIEALLHPSCEESKYLTYYNFSYIYMGTKIELFI